MSEADYEPMEKLGEEWTFENTKTREKKKSFWALAERAGLKAMGLPLRVYRPMSEYPSLIEILKANAGIIRAFVEAARKVKEAKNYRVQLKEVRKAIAEYEEKEK